MEGQAAQTQGKNNALIVTLSTAASVLLAIWSYNAAKDAIRRKVQKAQPKEDKKPVIEIKKETIIRGGKQQVAKPQQQTAPPKSNVEGAKQSASTTSGPKIVGKVDSVEIEKRNRHKKMILQRIEELKQQHAVAIKKSGWHNGQSIRNEIELLKAKLFYI